MGAGHEVAPDQPAVALRDVQRRFLSASGVEVIAIQDINLEVYPGEFVSIVGPSGSGKTTLLHVIGTLDSPTLGSVCILGKEITNATDKQLAALRSWSIGFVFQSFCLIETLSAIENVATGLLYRGVPRWARDELAIAALESVGLKHRAQHFPSELSGGERQRVAIARAVVGGRNLLLADEPTGNLDSRTGSQIWEVLRDLVRPDCAVIAVTHDTRCTSVSNRQFQMYDGLLAP